MTSSPPPDVGGTISSSSSSVPIGIDLGHSYACIGVWRNDNVDVIANDLGNRSTPVLLSFTDREVLFGEAAESQLAVNLKSTVHHAKRLLGLPYDHPTVQQLKSHVDYTITQSDTDSTPLIQLTYKGEEKRYRSEELLAMMISRLKGVADRYTGSDCKECVLAVPSLFSSSQRAALVKAGSDAGLSVLTVLNEATAAAIAFGLDLPQVAKGGKSKENIVVVDVGGATSTVTLLQREGGVLTQKAVQSDLHLGGDDFDAVLVRHFSAEFQRTTSLNLTSSHRALARLSFAVEKAKRVLSSSTSASIELDGLYEGEDFYSSVKRSKFETLASPLFKRLQGLIQGVLREANVSAVMVDHVCLIGGSSRIPRVQEMVKGVMGKDVKKGVNPEEAVAVGCTIQASLLAGRAKEWEAVQHKTEGENRGEIALGASIGVEGDDGVVQRVLSKGTTVPTFTTITLAPHRPSSATSPYLLRVYEGERALVSNNRHLATLIIPSTITTPITTSFTVDKQRKLHIRAYSGKTIHADVTLDPSLPSVAGGEGVEGEDGLVMERSVGRRMLYDYLLGLGREGGEVVEEGWKWLEGRGVEGKEGGEEFEKKREEVEKAVEEWREREKEAHGKGHGGGDVDDVDDYVANMSINGHADSKETGGGGDDFDHEIADLD